MADADTADSDCEPAMLMARLRQAIERPTTAFSRTSRRFRNAALQPVRRHLSTTSLPSATAVVEIEASVFEPAQKPRHSPEIRESQ